MEILEIVKRYGTQEQCIAKLEELKWKGKPVCPYCKSETSSKRKGSFRHQCRSCNASYSVLVGTIMESTKLPLPKWFLAMFLIINAKKGISSLQLARDLGVNKNTGWYLQKRIRQAMNEDDQILNGLVEADETYIGGSLNNKHEKLKKKRGYNISGMEHKTPVLGMIERKGKIVVKVLNKAWGQEIKPILKEKLAKESELITDGFGGYKDLGKYFSNHVILNHTKKVRKIGIYHTNTIEGFWSMLKRAIIGQYHKISNNHLQDYLNEMAFKYNYRNRKDAFNTLLFNSLKI
jgi:transposase-like protein